MVVCILCYVLVGLLLFVSVYWGLCRLGFCCLCFGESAHCCLTCIVGWLGCGHAWDGWFCLYFCCLCLRVYVLFLMISLLKLVVCVVVVITCYMLACVFVVYAYLVGGCCVCVSFI